MRTFLKVIGVLLIVLVGAALLVSQLISKDKIISHITEQVEEVTGRTLSVDGEVGLQIFPTLAINLEQVSFSNHAQSEQAHMVSLKQLSLDIPWIAALSGEIAIDKFVIDSPTILLEKFSDQQSNWQLLGNKSADTGSVNQEKSGTVTLPESFDLQLGQVQIVNGNLTYIDHTTAKTTKVEQLNLDVLLPSLKQPLQLNGQVTYMNEVIELNTELATPMKVITGDDFDMSLGVVSDLVNLSYKGDITEQTKKVSGKLTLKGDSLKQLLAWQNIPLDAKAEAFNAFSIGANMSFYQDELALSDIQVTLDELDIKGQTSVKLVEPIDISANVNLGRLNLNPYIKEQAANTSNESKADKPKEKQPIEWDDSPIDLSALGQLNADIRIQSTALLVKDIKLAENDLQITLKDKVAHIQLHTFKGYAGDGVGSIKVNAQNKPYKINTDFSLKGINAEPLLTDAVGFDKLLGKGELGWQLATTGVSQKSFINALNGQLNFNFVDGAVKGFNLAAIARSAESLLKGDFSKVNLDKEFSQSEKTDFASLGATFKVTDGVAETEDLAMVNPFIRVAGNGKVDLPQTKVNMKVKSTVVASSQGQQASDDAAGFTIPIKIKGPFHDVKVKPDVENDTKEKLKDKLKDKLKGLFG